MSGRAFLTPALLGAAGLAAAASGWVDAVSSHFVIRRQTAFSQGASAIDLEKLHNRLRLDLAMFSPWMAKERVTLYLYPDQRSYSAGEFHPPAWSNGIAFYDRRIMAVYAQHTPEKLDKIIAHEMTHLLFESYWAEARKLPPPWLNEGLAMMEETERADEEGRSEWHQAMRALGPARMIPFSRLVEINPNADVGSKEAASYWYVGAYSAVYFLYRQHSKLQFANFCKDLRDGRPLEDALWTHYRYASPAKFEAAWRSWLKGASARSLGRRSPIHAARASREEREEPAPSEAEADDGKPKLRPVKLKGMTFHNFRGDR